MLIQAQTQSMEKTLVRSEQLVFFRSLREFICPFHRFDLSTVGIPAAMLKSLVIDRTQRKPVAISSPR